MFAHALRSTGTRLGDLGALMVGSKGELVKALQRKIIGYDPQSVPKGAVMNAQYTPFVDGIFGPRTRDALSAFQRDAGEPVRGFADDAWLAKHGITASANTKPYKSPTNALVVDNGIYDLPADVAARFGLTETQKKFLLAGGVIAGALAAYWYWTRRR